MPESYELEARQAPTPRLGNEPVALGQQVGPSAFLCRGCSYWLTRAGQGVKCPECGGETNASLGEDWIGGANEAVVDGVRTCGRSAALGLLVGMIFLLLLVGLAALMWSQELAMVMLLGGTGGMSTYLGSQFRAQMWMRRISSRGGAWMMLSALGAAAVGVWLLLVCGLAVTTLLGGAPRGTTSDVFQAVSEWLALPGAALMMTAGGIGTWLWGPALGGDQAATRRVALATGIIGGGAAWMVWVCVIVIEWAMPRRNFGPGGDPTIAMILSYARWVGGVSALCAGVGVVMSGIVWGMVERRCKWVLEERAKAQS